MGSDKDSFKMHVKKHAQVPPKHCVLCDEGDAENFDLRNHVQSNVSIESFTILWSSNQMVFHFQFSIMEQICCAIAVEKHLYIHRHCINIENPISMNELNNVRTARKHLK